MTLEYGLTSEQAHINLHEFNRNEVSRPSSVWKVVFSTEFHIKGNPNHSEYRRRNQSEGKLEGCC